MVDYSIVFPNQVIATRYVMNNLASMNTPQAYTISFWVKPRTSNTTKMIKSLSGAVSISVGKNESLLFDLFIKYYNTGTVPYFSRWNHVTITFANKKLTAYVARTTHILKYIHG